MTSLSESNNGKPYILIPSCSFYPTAAAGTGRYIFDSFMDETGSPIPETGLSYSNWYIEDNSTKKIIYTTDSNDKYTYLVTPKDRSLEFKFPEILVYVNDLVNGIEEGSLSITYYISFTFIATFRYYNPHA